MKTVLLQAADAARWIPPEMSRAFVLALALLCADFMMVIVAVVVDLISAVRKIRREGVSATSRGYRRSIDKLLRYTLTLIVLSAVDVLLTLSMISLRQIMGWTLPSIPFVTTLGAVAMVLIEAKSVMENLGTRHSLKKGVGDTANAVSDLLDNEDLKRLVALIRKLQQHD